MKKRTVKFRDLVETMPLLGNEEGKTIISMSNLDDVVCELRSKGITEMRVNWKEMLDFARWTLGNINSFNSQNNDYSWHALKIIREGRVDKFFGIRLILEDY